MGNQEILKNRQEDLLKSVDNKIDEYSKSIFGYEETSDNDILFEEYVEFLNMIKSELEFQLEILNE